MTVVNDALEMVKDVVVACLKVYYQRMRGVSEKITNNLCQNSEPIGRDSNPALLEGGVGLLTTQLPLKGCITFLSGGVGQFRNWVEAYRNIVLELDIRPRPCIFHG